MQIISHRRCFSLKKVLYWVLVALFSVIFIFSAFTLGKYVINSIQYREQLKDLQQMHTNPTTRPTPTLRQPTANQDGTQPATRPTDPTDPGVDHTRPTTPIIPTLPSNPSGPVDRPTVPNQPDNPYGILPELAGIYQMNKDLVGWIYIAGTNINNPVVQRKDEKDYYLHRDFYKNYDQNGTIYVRETCDVFEPTDVLTLYGHSMFNGNMFAHVLKYTSKSFFDSHQVIYFDTLYERHTYQVVCVFRTSGDYGKGFPYHLFDDFADEAEYQEFIQGVRDLAIHDSGIPVYYGDKFILLSTCEDAVISNGRLVLVAVRVD